MSMMLDYGLKAENVRGAEFQIKSFVAKKLTPGFPPANRKEAMRSLPWVIACILDRDRPALTDPMTSTLAFDTGRAARLTPLAEKISWRADLDDDGPVAGRLKLDLSDGRVLSSEIAGYPGDGRQSDLRWGLDAIRTRINHLGTDAAKIADLYSEIIDRDSAPVELANAARSTIFAPDECLPK
jgi:hypothetical protein